MVENAFPTKFATPSFQMSSIDTGYGAPLEDELDDDEVVPVRRRRLPLFTGLLLASLVAAGAFVVGVEVQKHYGAAPSSGSTGSEASRGRSDCPG